jgi:hypothetical protein
MNPAITVAELIAQVYKGPNAIIFTFANVIALFCHRRLGVSMHIAFGMAAGVSGMMGALGALVQTTATAGQAPSAELNAALVGLIVGAGSSLVIAYALLKAIEKLGNGGKHETAPPP